MLIDMLEQQQKFDPYKQFTWLYKDHMSLKSTLYSYSIHYREDLIIVRTNHNISDASIPFLVCLLLI